MSSVTYQIVTRSQRSRGSSANRFGGPDMYVAVLEIPIGVEIPRTLNRRVLAMRGIKFYHCGEGYSRHTGPRSMYQAALAEAREFVIHRLTQ